MAEILGKPDFLFVADCKAASMETRSTIDRDGGLYLFPLPMTGETPTSLKELVPDPPARIQDIVLEPKEDQEEQRKVGSGFVVDKELESETEDGKTHRWRERWLVTLSDAHSARQMKAFKDRLAKAARQLDSMKPKKDEGADELLERARKVLKDKKLQNFVRVEVNETVEKKKKYKCKGRPGRNTPYDIVENRKLTLAATTDSEAIEQYLLLAGWRIFVANAPAERMSLDQAANTIKTNIPSKEAFTALKEGVSPRCPFSSIDVSAKTHSVFAEAARDCLRPEFR